MSHSAKFVCIRTSKSMILLKEIGIEDRRIAKKPIAFWTRENVSYFSSIIASSKL